MDKKIIYVNLSVAQGNQQSLADFYLMYVCDHAIISNSTFSWWAAWLSDREERTIVAPGDVSPWGNDWLTPHCITLDIKSPINFAFGSMILCGLFFNGTKPTIIDKIIFRGARSFFSDKVFIELLYKRIFHRNLCLDNPKTFNEKIQWLKLYDRKPLYTILADKFAVREYVINRVGEKYLNELIGVYDNVQAIPIDSLPDEFCLKTTHGSGWNILSCIPGLM